MKIEQIIEKYLSEDKVEYYKKGTVKKKKYILHLKSRISDKEKQIPVQAISAEYAKDTLIGDAWTIVKVEKVKE